MSNFTTITPIVTGYAGTAPMAFSCSTPDSLATITAAGYLDDQGDKVKNGDIFFINYADVSVQPLGGITGGQSSLHGEFYASIVSSHMNLIEGTSGPMVVTDTTSSATPGTIRALTGKMIGTATVMISGNLVGVRGEVDMVGASGGFVYGVQGKVIPTGTISSSVWVAGVFGQFDLSGSTITTGQLACLWGDMGTTATSGTYTGLRGIAMTNTTAAIANSQIYLYGGATNLLELDDNNGLVGATYFVAAGTSSGSAGDTSKCNASKVVKITFNGTNYWIPLFASNS